MTKAYVGIGDGPRAFPIESISAQINGRVIGLFAFVPYGTVNQTLLHPTTQAESSGVNKSMITEVNLFH